MICPTCNGFKETLAFGCPGFIPIQVPCPTCDGTGEVDEVALEQSLLADTLRHQRIDRREALHDAAARFNLTVPEYSAIERGKCPMPDHVKATILQ